MKKHLLFLTALSLVGCSSSNTNTAESFDSLTQCKAPNSRSFLRAKIDEPTQNSAHQEIKRLFNEQRVLINSIWGKDGQIQSDQHRFVKYLDSFKTRADIHFDTGKVYVSTINDDKPLEKLQNAIVQVILMPPDPKDIDLLGAQHMQHSKTPFFLGQLLDQNDQVMDTEDKARNYAKYLIANKLQEKKFMIGSANFIEMSLIQDHNLVREYKFAKEVRDAAKKYNIREDLIYAVMKTESSFNPYAVSHSGALGLMQIVPTTAGADVFKLIKNKDGIPSKDYLFEPANNIDTGTAYLSLLQDRYLKSIENHTSKHFAMISAYNGGTGNVLSTFHNNRDTAMNKINNTAPRQVYCILTQHHPREESRNYLNKVLKAQRNFNLNEV